MKGKDASMVDYTLIRARRRTAAIQIQKDGQVVVRAPMRLPKKEIERFLQEKESWILAQQQRMRQRQQRREQFALSDGRLPLLGKFFPLEQTDSAKPSYQDGVFCLPRGGEEQLRQQAQLLYRQIAREELTRRVAFYAPKLGVQPTGLRINGAKGRWGSCSGKNSLNFSWRLMLAPEHCVNYVVVHELCHILHHDHSAAFWREVERFFPDWRECRRQLAEVAGAAYFFDE